jgi:hypothetical protein
MVSPLVIMAAASAIQSVSGGFDAVKQSHKTNKEISATAIRNIKEAGIKQDANRGAMRTAFSKAGVTTRGTPEITMNEQITQDELMLETIKYNAQNAIKSNSKAGQNALLNSFIGTGTSLAGQFMGSAGSTRAVIPPQN